MSKAPFLIFLVGVQNYNQIQNYSKKSTCHLFGQSFCSYFRLFLPNFSRKVFQVAQMFGPNNFFHISFDTDDFFIRNIDKRYLFADYLALLKTCLRIHFVVFSSRISPHCNYQNDFKVDVKKFGDKVYFCHFETVLAIYNHVQIFGNLPVYA